LLFRTGVRPTVGHVELYDSNILGSAGSIIDGFCLFEILGTRYCSIKLETSTSIVFEVRTSYVLYLAKIIEYCLGKKLTTLFELPHTI
jgi:hypothetical protein